LIRAQMSIEDMFIAAISALPFALIPWLLKNRNRDLLSGLKQLFKK
jgi:hypothetical protein